MSTAIHMDDVAEVTELLSAGDIAERVGSLSKDISASLHGKPVSVVSLLRGSFMFTADLVRALSMEGIHPNIDFMTLGSYGKGTESSGQVTLHHGLMDEVSGKTVLLIDDILESGRTLAFAKNLLASLGAAEVLVAVLLEKPGKRKASVQADFIGFTVPDRFVVGYGLDWANRYRELPFIGVPNGA